MRDGITEEDVARQALAVISAATSLPRLAVFDLDYTLWPFKCECQKDNPYLYPEAKGILKALKEKEVKLAVASRTLTPDIARLFLTKLGLTNFFVEMEIFPSWTPKTEHFEKIHQKTKIPFSSMIFFDDGVSNIQCVSRMGVTSVLVDDGVNIRALQNGLADFANAKQ
ncbi:hypothetical protein KP509_02G103000 [Ceratopteris richardii]|uniref:Magnesium-dependent phosphatase 1 n=1 Tax=Ceratopteris richardii TaxID=49495 RepID=A0A8T2V999_CERRI|nr:hypothetical protein KP509_02G103000 [Ceratopteris richardii]